MCRSSTVARAPSSAANKAARLISSRMKAALTPSVRRTKVSNDASGRDMPWLYRAKSWRRQLASGVGISIAWSIREGGFQDIGPVRRQDEDDIGVVLESVHLVQQLEQQRITSRVISRSF